MKKFFEKKVNIKEQSTTKKISFFSTILLVIGSTVGAGVFVKNNLILGNVWGSMVFTIIAWLIACFAILMLGFSLVELCSAKNMEETLGIVGWIKCYTNDFLYKAFRNFYGFLYIPLFSIASTYFFVQFFADGIGWKGIQWWEAMIISIAVLTYFLIVSGISSNAASVQNKIFMTFKFIPIAFAMVIGFVFVCNHAPSNSWFPINPNTDNPQPDETAITPLLDRINPYVGIFASIPAIFYAYNGFYTPASRFKKMKNPEKSGLALGLGISIITFIYILVAISLVLSTQNGKIIGLKVSWPVISELVTVMQLIIAFTLLSVVNGMSTTIGIYYEKLIINHEIVFAKKLSSKANIEKPIIGCLYGVSIILSYLFVLTIVGTQFSNTSGLNFDSASTNGLFSFIDMVTNWYALFIFLCISISIFGCIKNRKTNKVEVKRSKFFLPCAWVGITMVWLSALYVFASVFVNIGLVAYYISANKYSDPTTQSIAITHVTITLCTLILFLGVMFVGPTIDLLKKKKQLAK